MCGRTALSLEKEKLQCACSYKAKNANLFSKPLWLPEYNAGKDYTPSYNIAPTEVTPVLISASRFQTTECDRVLKPMMWGIIPPWHKGDYKTHNLNTNNCRLENIKSSKLYSPILKYGGRCIIIVEGFYEWQTTNKTPPKVKQPYYIYAPQHDGIKVDEPDTWNNNFDEKKGWRGIRLLHMAGLYNVWQNEEKIIYSYSVITMDSNNTLDWLHHRMPAVLNSEEQIEAWLDIDKVEPEMALSYLQPIKLLAWHQVSSAVNNSRNKTTDCNKKISEKKYKNTQKTLNSWFVKVEKRKLSVENNHECKKTKM